MADENPGGGGGSPPPPPPPPPSPPAPTGGDKKFYDGWPADVVAHIEASKYPDPLEIARADMNARKLIGVPHDQLVRRPAQGYEVDAKPYHAALEVLGAPKEAKAYIEAGLFKPVDGLGQLDEPTQIKTADLFKKADLLPWQAKIVMEGYTDLAKGAKTTMDAARDAETQERNGRLDAYRAEQGAKFEPAVKAMRSVIAKFDRPLTGDLNELKAKGLVQVDENGVIRTDATGNPIPKGELQAWLDETGAGNDPRFLRAFTGIASRFDSSALVPDGGGNQDAGGMTKAQAKEELAKIEKHPALLQSGHPEHKEIVRKRTELLKLAG